MIRPASDGGILFLLVVCCLAICGCSKAQVPNPSATPAKAGILLKDVKLTGSELPTDIYLEGPFIKVVGEFKGEAGRTIDCKGLVALPGFIDAHVHLGFFRPNEVLNGGLTTVRDLGWDPAISLGWVGQSQTPDWGPKVLAAGPMITVDGGYPLKAGWAPRGTGAVYKSGLVKSLAALDTCVVKVTLEPGAGPTLSQAQLTEIVQEADLNNLKVVAHTSTLPELKKALDSDVHEFCHFLFDESLVPDEIIQQMIRQKVVVNPTLRANPHPNRLANLGKFYEAGGEIVYGTDLGNGGRPGIDVKELKLMEQAGMSPEDIIQSATISAAEHLGLPKRGRLEPGAFADIILVEGDPLENWGVLTNPKHVIREGVVIKSSS